MMPFNLTFSSPIYPPKHLITSFQKLRTNYYAPDNIPVELKPVFIQSCPLFSIFTTFSFEKNLNHLPHLFQTYLSFLQPYFIELIHTCSSSNKILHHSKKPRVLNQNISLITQCNMDYNFKCLMMNCFILKIPRNSCLSHFYHVLNWVNPLYRISSLLYNLNVLSISSNSSNSNIL